MFKWSYDDRFIFFLQNDASNRVPVKEWHHRGEAYLAPYSVLAELFDNGAANYQEDAFIVPTLEVVKLSEEEREALFLPPAYPYEIYIESVGQLNLPTFQFKYGFFDFLPNGTMLPARREGPLVSFNNQHYLLSVNQFLVCEAMDTFNALPENERSFTSNLNRFADIRNFSKDAACLLDSYLQSQYVYHPDKIRIGIEFTNNTLELIPLLDSNKQTGFLKAFDQFSSPREIYPVSDADGVTRVTFNSDQVRELKNIKSLRKVTDGAMVREIIHNPERYFDGDVVDLTVFYSDRVKEIGIYQPRFYPFVCPYKSEWIPGLTIKDRIHGEKKIYLKSPSDLDEFEAEKNSALKKGHVTVEWEGASIPMEEAERLIRVAKKQFESPKSPLKQEAERTGDQVLIIKENAELTEYSQNNVLPSSLTHSFSAISNLNESVSLKDHQIEGVSWLQTLVKESVSGCLLADDMGLGKTLQLLYFIEWHAQFVRQQKPYLVVAPVSLLENWENEYSKFFTPQSLPLTLFYNDLSMKKQFDPAEVQRLQYQHIILTNYETLRTYQLNLCAVDYSVVVLDEAQKIKTPGTQVTNVSKALKADFKIAMTGTPVENTLVDLWCIMDFSVPGLLGNAKDFAKEFQHPLNNNDTDIKELGERLRDKIGVFIKRRLKQDVAKDLPSKFDNDSSRIRRVMPPLQLERYQAEMELARTGSEAGAQVHNQVLKSLWAIRDISDHPYLVDQQVLKFTAGELVATSAKLQLTIEILTEIKFVGEKAVVFADRKDTQRMLQKVIYAELGVFPSIINGDTPSSKQNENKAKLSRQQTIDKFQQEEDFHVIIMSPLAAGVGLNVTGANHVIHYSRHWNPAKEEQATDRAYRIGQQKDVRVYYPMAVFPKEMRDEEGKSLRSFDEILDHLLARKKALAASTLFPTEQAEVRPDEIFGNVFGFHTHYQATPLDWQQVSNLHPSLFEAFLAVHYQKQGYVVHLTPRSSDKGADVVAIKENANILIQAKQTVSLVGIEAIQEITGAKNYYQQKFAESFQLMVITNSDYTPQAEMLSRANQVQLIRRKELDKMISSLPVTMQEVNRMESQRMHKV